MDKKEDLFFVQVNEPGDVRRNILESLKEIVETLHQFEKFKDLREEKNRKIGQLKSDLRNINRLVSDLKNFLPEEKLNEIKVGPELKEQKPKLVRKKSVKKNEDVKVKGSELERLESELSAIEEKLKNL